MTALGVSHVLLFPILFSAQIEKKYSIFSSNLVTLQKVSRATTEQSLLQLSGLNGDISKWYLISGVPPFDLGESHSNSTKFSPILVALKLRGGSGTTV